MKIFRILLVDDDDIFRSLLVRNFEQADFSIDEAANAGEAVGLLCEHEHDLVITDYTMPGVSGADLVRRIRSLERTMPVIGMSALDCSAEFLRAGATYFFRKPFEIRVLEELVYGIALMKSGGPEN